MKEYLIIFSPIFLFCLETFFLWDAITQLAGLNEDLSENNCKWKTKTIKRLRKFFPTKRIIRFKKVAPENLYLIIFNFQIVLYILYLISLINLSVSFILYFISLETDILLYSGAFTIIDIIIKIGVSLTAYYLVKKECNRISKTWQDFE